MGCGGLWWVGVGFVCWEAAAGALITLSANSAGDVAANCQM